jgi:hypothetical protein
VSVLIDRLDFTVYGFADPWAYEIQYCRKYKLFREVGFCSHRFLTLLTRPLHLPNLFFNSLRAASD